MLMGKDNEALNLFRTRLAQLILESTNTGEEENGSRTVSPLDLCGSGTESELCDRSPLLSRKRRSTEGEGSGGSFRSSSSSDDNDIKTNIEGPSPPSNVRLAADLRNGRYLICWSPPDNFTGVQGYKIYIREVMRKYIASTHCTKAVIECNLENDWMFINVRTVAGENGQRESTPVAIDVDRSKIFVQNITLNNLEATKGKKKTRDCVVHDANENDDEEECSEV